MLLIPLLFDPDALCCVIYISKPEHFTEAFSDSTVDDSECVPLTHPACDSTVPDIKFLNKDVFYALPGLNLQKAYKSKDFLLFFLKIVLP